MSLIRLILIAMVCALWLPPSLAQAQDRGPVTNRPLPRFVSVKPSEANVRRGPSLTHRIDWVFQHRNMPVEIIDEYGHWRRVRDRDGASGWMHYTLLSGARTVIVEEEDLYIYVRPDPQTRIVAQLEQGVIARLGKCTLTWCRITADEYKGWAPKTALWGVNDNEIRE